MALSKEWGGARAGARYKDEMDCYLLTLCRAGPEVRMLQCCSSGLQEIGIGTGSSLLATIVHPALTFRPRIKLIVKDTKMHPGHEVLGYCVCDFYLIITLLIIFVISGENSESSGWLEQGRG